VRDSPTLVPPSDVHPPIPGRPSRSAFGNTVFLLFTLVQLGDGVLTYRGMRVFGIGIEANPLIAWFSTTVGAGLALVGAKSLALLCATVLHLTARHQVIAALTLAYLVAAIWPWTRLIWP
jgi:hypothetical protein